MRQNRGHEVQRPIPVNPPQIEAPGSSTAQSESRSERDLKTETDTDTERTREPVNAGIDYCVKRDGGNGRMRVSTAKG